MEVEGSGALTDAELLQRWLDQRDQAAFEALVWRLGPLVLGVCRRLLQRPEEIEDAFQATFLILLRKAATIHRHSSLAGWLYRVAHRAALRLRSSKERRQQQEQVALAEPAEPSSDELLWRDLRPVLDQEIGRLPERYRIAFVLCYLQGKTNAEAARELGIPVGTILSRLAWARERLRDRLGRRGVTLTVAGLISVLGQAVAEAAPPQDVVTAALRLPAGEVPVTVMSVAKGVMQSMTLTQLKVAAVVVVALGLLGTAGGLLYQAEAQVPGRGKGAAVPVQPVRDREEPALAAPEREPAPARNKVEVASERDGIVQLIGTSLSKKEIEAVDARQQEQLFRTGKWIKGGLSFLFLEEQHPEKYPRDELLKFADDPMKQYRLRNPKADALTPGMIRIAQKEFIFRKLKVGDSVKEGELLGLIDPKLALDEAEIKLAGFDAAEAERRAAEKTRDEGKKRYESILAARRVVANAVSNDEMRAAEMTWQRYQEEEVAKRAALRKAEREVNAAMTILRMHEIRSPVTGVIRKIYKQRGEGIKALEPLIQIEFDEEP